MCHNQQAVNAHNNTMLSSSTTTETKKLITSLFSCFIFQMAIRRCEAAYGYWAVFSYSQLSKKSFQAMQMQTKAIHNRSVLKLPIVCYGKAVGKSPKIKMDWSVARMVRVILKTFRMVAFWLENQHPRRKHINRIKLLAISI